VNMVSDGNRNGKSHPGTGHEGPDGVEMCSSNLSLTSALDGVGGQVHASDLFHPGKDTRYPLCKRLGTRQNRSGQVRKTLTMPKFDPRTVQSIASCYPDHASPVTLTALTVMLTVPGNSLPTSCI
jgi:hypothetical protein